MSHSIEYYTNNKNKIQDFLYRLSETQLQDIFMSITARVPNVQYSKNRNGYFMDIKQLPVEVIESVEKMCRDFLQVSSSEEEDSN